MLLMVMMKGWFKVNACEKFRNAYLYFAPLTLTLEKAMSMWLDVRFFPRIPASLAHLLMSEDVASAPFALLANFLKASSIAFWIFRETLQISKMLLSATYWRHFHNGQGWPIIIDLVLRIIQCMFFYFIPIVPWIIIALSRESRISARVGTKRH